MNDFPLFEDDEAIELGVQIAAREREALAAVRALENYARQHPERAMLIVGAMRKVSTISGAAAQSIGLKAER